MKILWMTWKDGTHPEAGGAEVVNEQLAKRLIADGHEVKFIVGGYKDCKQSETINGMHIVRLGNRYTVYHKTRVYYQKNLKGWADLVIDEVNTLPFLAKFYVKEPNILFVHMLCRVIWFYQLPKYIGWIGYILEPVYLRALSDRKVITISESTKADLLRHGFKSDNISIISEGIEIDPVSDLSNIKKYEQPTLLSLGALRPMKRTLDQVKAFELAKESIPNLKLKVAGDTSGVYGEKVLDYIQSSRFSTDIEVLGRVSRDMKIELMQKSHLLLVTSIKEGWGLVVTEAASQGTPSIAYDVDGLRDSVKNDVTGKIVPPNPEQMSRAISTLLQDKKTYAILRMNGYEWSTEITFDRSYNEFKKRLQI